MAFTRPVVGADISAADFGQPVYDGIIRQGFTRTGTDMANVPTAVTGVPLATLRESAGTAWAANGANTLFTCPVAGVYSMYASGFSAGVPPVGTYMGVHITGIMRARHYLNASVQPYVSFIATCLAVLNVGDTVGIVYGAGSGTHSFGSVPWPGYASDSAAPMLSVWRVGL